MTQAATHIPDRAHPEYLDSMINETDAARFLGYSVRALQNWRVRGGGPNFIKVSARSIRYRRRDLIAWAEAKLVASTSAPLPA
jgi:Helix-turn-helix domain